jgi:hypothetical protein
MIVGQSLLWMFTAPTSALIVNQMPASVRSRAFSFQMMMSHALGVFFFFSLIMFFIVVPTFRRRNKPSNCRCDIRCDI